MRNNLSQKKTNAKKTSAEQKMGRNKDTGTEIQSPIMEVGKV